MDAKGLMKRKKILSICIPTYNMGYKVMATIDYLLQCKDDRFNIIVLDNCSTDGSFRLLKQKESEKVVIKQNNENLGASLNYIEVLKLSNSNFCLTLLDKDTLDVAYIPEFLDILETESEIFGYCALNYGKEGKHDILRWKKGVESVESMAYLSKHPTGYFYDTHILKESLKEPYYANMDQTIPFPYEIINAHLGVHYNSCKIMLPLCYPESREKNTTRSMSYTEENLFYAPKRRNIEYAAYLEDALSLDLEKKQIKRLVKKLYAEFLYSVSLGYSIKMKDEFLCNHYYVEKREIPILEQIKYSRLITRTTKKILKNFFSKAYVFRMTEEIFAINALAIVRSSCK